VYQKQYIHRHQTTVDPMIKWREGKRQTAW